MLKKMIFGIFFLIYSFSAMATQNKNLSLDLHHASIQDAIHIYAKFLHQNVIISPQIKGQISIHLTDVSMQEAFDLILLSQHLFKYRIGNTWFIMSHDDFVRQQEDQLKIKTTIEQTAPMITRFWQIKYAKAEDIARLLQDSKNSLLSVRGQIQADPRSNTLCASDLENHLLAVQEFIHTIDIPIQQVLIETRLASIDSDCERDLGINFAVQAAKISSAVNATTAGPVHYGIAVAKLADGAFLDVQLSALEKTGHGELISSPSLFASNQQPAFIESGEEIPYQETSENGGTVVAFKKAVLSLKVTPQVLPGNKVMLQLQINQDRPSNRIVLGVPAISTRQISTNILVGNGQTLVLGGIYESNHENAEHRVPFLGKIPLVGWLFKQQNVTENKRELLIFVTPKIIHSDGER